MSSKSIALFFFLDPHFGGSYCTRTDLKKAAELFIFHTVAECFHSVLPTFKISGHKKLKPRKILFKKKIWSSVKILRTSYLIFSWFLQL